MNILDLTVRELIEGYGLMYSPECDYNYGLISNENAEQMLKEYDLDDCPSVAIEDVIHPDVIDLTPLSYTKIQYIMRNLGIERRNEDG